METIYITAKHGIIGDGEKTLSPIWVGIDGDKITYVDSIKPEAANEHNTTDMGECTLTPGLFNLHDHVNRKQLRFDADLPLGVRSAQFMGETKEYMLMHGVHNMKEMLKEGITFVRDFGLGGYTALTLRRAIKEGLVPGPEMITCGMDIVQSGGHCYKYAKEADGCEEVMKAVREEIRAGADFIKMMASGGLEAFPREDPKYPEYTLRELQAASEVAHDAGYKITAHVYPKEAIMRILQADFDCVEHGVMMDDECIELMVKKGTPLVPTMTGVKGSFFIKPVTAQKKASIPLLEERIWGPHAISVKKAIQAGIPVGTGTDTYGWLADEIRTIAEAADLNPVQAIAHATSISAKIVDRPDLGLLEVGKHANVVAFPGDVTKSLDTISNARQLWLHGKPQL
ncbi:amidohydrolase family protein [Dysosmobacter sp.]|uniref:amidohydrolase family protein n=1 Tax=Dysosmobacter sp. TaxID=2591382 RepID=UPI002A889125|nr:amidohydrolase family protein [Dysosmobacter sp.]MDY3282357.1 amidohydrolase family protein [Dysosmobacter sp.]